LVKLDLGCGKNKKEGFLGVDCIPFEGVDVVCNLGNDVWPWEDKSVDEVHCSHMLEHLKPKERIHFANELYRVLKVGAKAAISTPHYASVRAFGDLTHEWPPVVTFWYLYLNKEWRTSQAPHNTEYTCDFDHGYGFGLHPMVQLRNQDYQNYAVIHLLEGAQDLLVTLTRRE
jgi:predicted SAM-dependent methyltransferase